MQYHLIAQFPLSVNNDQVAGQATRLWERGKAKNLKINPFSPFYQQGIPMTDLWLRKGIFKVIELHHKEYVARTSSFPSTFSRGTQAKYKIDPAK